MLKTCLFLLVCFLNLNAVNAQNNGRAFEIPEKYKIAKFGVSDDDAFRLIAGTIWEVYSDRCNNLTYTQPSGRLVKAVLSFMDKFYVAERKPDFLRIMKDPDISPHGFFSDKAEDYGWIHVSKLLLWDHCLVSSNHIDKKVVLSNASFGYDLDKHSFTHKPNDAIPVYEDPELRFAAGVGFSPFDIFFLYKSCDNAWLVGNNPRLQLGENPEACIGWVSKSNALIWENRIAIEPNWEAMAVAERKRNRIVTCVFFDPVSASMFMAGRFVHQDYVLWQNDPYEHRMPGEMLRFPVLSNHGELLKVAVFGKLSAASYRAEQLTNILRASEFTRTVKDYTLSFTPFFEKNLTTSEVIPADINPGFVQVGYTPFKANNLRQPLFKHVFMLSKLELANQIRLYDELVKAKSRKNVQVALLETLKRQMPGKNEQDILELPLTELLPAYLELPVYHDHFPKGRLRDLTRPWIIDDETYNSFLKKTEQKLIKLQAVFNQANHLYSFGSNGIRYYWIPAEDLL